MVTYFLRCGWPLQWPLAIGMSAMLLLTGAGHFMYTPGMVLMMPPFIPAKKFMVLATGVLEILAAIGLLIPSLRSITAICLVIFFVLILPANVYSSMKKVNLVRANYEGPGLPYLWQRIPFQVVLIAWVLYLI